MSDRHAIAHAMRSAIHGWLKAHPQSRMPAIVTAFSGTPAATVRKAVQRLAALGSVARRGDGTATVYAAIGNKIYAAAVMRKRAHAGRPRQLLGYNRVRLERAWLARSAIHAFVKTQPQCRMGAIEAAFRALPAATVRKHVRALCLLENIVMHGGSIAARYSAATDAIYAIDDAQQEEKPQRAAGLPAGSTSAVLVAAPGLTAARCYTNQPNRHAPRKTPDAIGSGGVCYGGHASCERLA